jgi:hypothetical protein
MGIMSADAATLDKKVVRGGGVGAPLPETVRLKGTIGVIGLTQSLRQRGTHPSSDVLVEHPHS